jgi:hypothetical protein
MCPPKKCATIADRAAKLQERSVTFKSSIGDFLVRIMYLSNGCANAEFYGRSEGPRQPDPLPDFSKMETTVAFFRAESNSGRDI